MDRIKEGDLVYSEDRIGYVSKIFPSATSPKDDFNIEIKWSNGATLYYTENEMDKLKDDYKKIAKEALYELKNIDNGTGDTNNPNKNVL
jgi:hypothetical protein